MMSVETDARRADYIALVKASVEKEKLQAEKLDLDEMEVDFKNDLQAPLTSAEEEEDIFILHGTPQGGPLDDEIMSYDREGKPLSLYGDSIWSIYNKMGELKNFYMGLNHDRRELDFNDPLTVPLRILQRLLLYVVWPGKNLAYKPLTAGSLKVHHTTNNMLLGWFYAQGFFLSESASDVESARKLITSELLKEKLNQDIDNKESVSGVYKFAVGIKKWLQLADKNYCPAWFKPNFNYQDVFDPILVDKMSKYLSQNSSRWEAIDFDDLSPLMETSKNYIDIYSKDLFWINKKLHGNQSTEKHSSILNKGDRKQLFEEFANYNFANDPETNEPWLPMANIIAAQGDRKEREKYIPLRIIYQEFSILVGACSFILFSFTGSRINEMRNVKESALTVNGIALDCAGNVLEQIESGEIFNLDRKLFKTSSSPTGKNHNTPIPKIAAKAFAILIEVFRYARECTGSEFLFPTGGIVHAGQSGQSTGNKPIYNLSIYLSYICSAAGVDYQHSHKCRKTLATLLINNDPKSLEIIQYLLGHNSAEMTFEYIMSLPGVNEEILNHMREYNLEKMVQFVANAIEGKVAGPAGNRALDSISSNLEAWSGTRIPATMETLLKSFENSNFFIHRTPAAWCIRFPTRVPHSAPCLPRAIQESIEKGTIVDGTEIHPSPEHCIPWECGDAGFTTDDLEIAKRSLQYAKEKASSASSVAQANSEYYDSQVAFWSEVVSQLEHGRADIADLHLFENCKHGGYL